MMLGKMKSEFRAIPAMTEDNDDNFHDEQKRKAMTMFLDSWDEACSQGIPSELLVEVCLYLAITDLIEERGEEDVAEIFNNIPARIRAGEFTLHEESH